MPESPDLAPAWPFLQQLLEDLKELRELGYRWSSGDESAREEYDQVEGAIDAKLAFLDGAQKAQ